MSAVIYTQETRESHLLKDEYKPERGYCRAIATVNVASETALTVGSVLGKVTATGKYVPRDPAATDGSEVSAAVVLENKTVAATTDTDVVALVRGKATVAKQALVFDVTHTQGEQDTAIAELEALEIFTREQLY